MTTPTPPPAASEGDSELAEKLAELLSPHALDQEDGTQAGDRQAISDIIEPHIAAHTRQAVSQAVESRNRYIASLEKEVEHWKVGMFRKADSDRESLRACVVRLKDVLARIRKDIPTDFNARGLRGRFVDETGSDCLAGFYELDHDELLDAIIEKIDTALREAGRGGE